MYAIFYMFSLLSVASVSCHLVIEATVMNILAEVGASEPRNDNFNSMNRPRNEIL